MYYCEHNPRKAFIYKVFHTLHPSSTTLYPRSFPYSDTHTMSIQNTDFHAFPPKKADWIDIRCCEHRLSSDFSVVLMHFMAFLFHFSLSERLNFALFLIAIHTPCLSKIQILSDVYLPESDFCSFPLILLDERLCDTLISHDFPRPFNPLILQHRHYHNKFCTSLKTLD